MKNKKVMLAAVIAAASIQTSFALSEAQKTALDASIQSTPAIELAAKASELVVNAKKSDTTDTAVAVVRAAGAKSAVSISSVVSAIVSVKPAIAPQVVAAAIQIAPDQTELLAKIAIVAAPDQGQEIIDEVGKTTPGAQPKVAQVVESSAKATAQNSVRTRNSTRQSRSSAVVTGGNLTTRSVPIFGKAYPGGTFPIIPPSDVSNYAAPGSDPTRP